MAGADGGRWDEVCLAQCLGLCDQIRAHGISDTRRALYPRPGRYADYLLTTPGIRIRHVDVPATPAVSDHRALILDFDLHAARH